MTHAEACYCVTAALLRSGRALTASALAQAADVPRVVVRQVLQELEARRDVQPSPAPGPQPWAYAWAALPPGDTSNAPLPGIDSLLVRRFHDFVLHGYQPPAGKEVLAVFQCCVGRPFYRTGSHAAMRRAVEAATGWDPWRDFVRCPVHVVVLASHIGPVPYDLQTRYPATVAATGVKQMSPEAYERVRPVLVERVAAYLRRHAQYRHIATFTDGRYAQIMRQVAQLTGRPIVVLPRPDGAEVRSIGGSRPRTYWQRYWVQLAQQLALWHGPAAQRALARRLQELQVLPA